MRVPHAVFLELRLSPQAARLLTKLVRTGLFGRSPSAAAERLLMERLRDLKSFPELVPKPKMRPTSPISQGKVRQPRLWR